MPAFNSKPTPQPVYSEEERITYEEVPAGTLMRVFRNVGITDGVEKIIVENKEVLWGKTKEDIVAQIDEQKTALEAETTAQISKLEALQVKLNKK